MQGWSPRSTYSFSAFFSTKRRKIYRTGQVTPSSDTEQRKLGLVISGEMIKVLLRGGQAGLLNTTSDGDEEDRIEYQKCKSRPRKKTQ